MGRRWDKGRGSVSCHSELMPSVCSCGIWVLELSLRKWRCSFPVAPCDADSGMPQSWNGCPTAAPAAGTVHSLQAMKKNVKKKEEESKRHCSPARPNRLWLRVALSSPLIPILFSAPAPPLARRDYNPERLENHPQEIVLADPRCSVVGAFCEAAKAVSKQFCGVAGGQR